uniref:Uncharacterized protein n=1 Tax=Rhizophora mucronata TaxID=61149 RepID=A0A2P2NUW0_RHIMU
MGMENLGIICSFDASSSTIFMLAAQLWL